MGAEEQVKHRIPFDITIAEYRLIGEALPFNTQFQLRFTDGSIVYITGQEKPFLDEEEHESYNWVLDTAYAPHGLFSQSVGAAIEEYFEALNAQKRAANDATLTAQEDHYSLRDYKNS